MKKQIILIDGENLVHKLVSVLLEAKQIHKREDIKYFDLRGLVHQVLGGDDYAKEIFYYTAKVREVKSPASLKKKTQAMISWNARWVPMLANQGIRYVKSGNLQVRDTKECTNCGRTSLVMQEKGVDVRIATDILLNAAPEVEIVVVSSDSDLIPAISAARQRGASIVYLGFEFAMNIALVSQSTATRSISRTAVVEAYKRAQKP